MAVIEGDSNLAIAGRKYVEDSIREFKARADTEVPDMRAEFGADSPSANYAIGIEAKLLESEKTEALLFSGYTYTGGANANSFYHSLNFSKEGGMITLGNIVPEDKREALVAKVKKELLRYNPGESEPPVVFADIVAELKFEDLRNWSLEADNLTVYFDKHEVGPGAIGAVPLRMPIAEVAAYLQLPN